MNGSSIGTTRTTARWLRTLSMGVVAGAMTLTSLSGVAAGQSGTQPKAAAGFEAYNAILIFRSGRTLEGVVISESPTKVKVKATQDGISFETEYDRAEILTISKKGPSAAEAPAKAPAAAKPDAAAPKAEAATPPENTSGKVNLYWMDLEGKFGEEITQTPIRRQIKDAQANKADVIVMFLNADFSENPLEQLPNDAANFDEVFRAESIVPIFTEEISREWDTPPRLVMWVRQAMAGASLLPFVIPEIYMHSEGRIGGIGNLSIMFGSMGDDVVREKQRSLRLGHAEGWAISGGYDGTRIIRAMARVEYVLSVRYVNGKPELFEGYPSNPGEELLTDDGKEGNADSLPDRVAGRGNDVLTLDARLAKLLGVSKGTIDTRDELLVALGIDQTYRDVPGRSRQIQKQWNDGLDNARRTLRRLVEDYGDVRVAEPNNYQNRTKARGQRKAILNQMKGLLKQWGEALSARFLQEYGIPGIPDIDSIIETIDLEQQKDRR